MQNTSRNSRVYNVAIKTIYKNLELLGYPMNNLCCMLVMNRGKIPFPTWLLHTTFKSQLYFLTVKNLKYLY